MPRKLTLVHTVGALAPRFRDLIGAALAERQVDDVVIDDVVREELLQRTIADGELGQVTRDELAEIVRARQANSEAILVTCSSLGPAVDELNSADTAGTPVLRVDEPMARRAVELGTRIGVLATLSTTMEPTTDLLERLAQQQRREIDVLARVCEGAFDAVRTGDTDRHDQLVRDGLFSLLDEDVEVVVLAQASMARVVDTLPEPPAVPVLSSPEPAVDHLIELLARTR